MTRAPLIATGSALALVLGLVPVLVAPAADAATAPAIGAVFVADTGNNRVVEVAPDGTQQDIGSGFNAPQGVAVDAAGNVFVADTGNNRVVEVPADGGPQVAVGSGFSSPTGVTITPDGVVLVLDQGNDRVVTMNEDGSSEATLTGNWSDGPVLAVAVGPDINSEYIWVVLANAFAPAYPDSIVRIGLHDYNDVQVVKDGPRSPGPGIVINPQGIRYQSNADDNDVVAIGGPVSLGAGMSDPHGVALTPDGNVVAADTGHDSVLLLTPDGSSQTPIGGGFSGPTGVADYAPPPTFTAANPPNNLLAGVPYSYTFTATAPAGEPTPVISHVGSNALLNGITLDSSTGTMSGTPEALSPADLQGGGESADFLVQAANGATATVITVSLSLTATLFTAVTPPGSATVGVPYAGYTFAADGAAPVTYTAFGGFVGQATPLPPGLTLDPTTGVLSGTPTASGDWGFYVKASNSYGYQTCCNTMLDIHVDPPVANRPPAANDDTLSTKLDNAASVNVLTNDTDPDGNTLSVSASTNGAHGAVSCAGAGSCTYTPDAGYTGLDSFTYTVSDGNGGTAVGSVNVTVGAAAHSVLVSAFRLAGPNGPADDYVELANNTGAALVLSGWQLGYQTGGGTSTVAIGDATLPAGGRLLLTGSSYSLTTAGDQSLGADLPDDPGGLQVVAPDGTVTDAAGFTTSSAGYNEGGGLAAPANTATQYAYVRTEQGGKLNDTDVNVADFTLISATPADLTGSQLGNPEPDSASSPVEANGVLRSTLLDTAVAAKKQPNRQITGSIATHNEQLAIRRTITNTGATTITSARVRITSLSTVGSPGAHATLRWISSSSGTSRGFTYNGLTIDAANSADGGGVGSTATVPLPAGSLAPGASVTVEFLFAVDAGGPYWFTYDVDATS